ncbi:MAG: Txe/YoeB family addiction module toxin [Bacteroidales bacterium]|nr:Txe/YoeB family addiction module toxin [Bacteroidales bacterium]
MSYKIYFAKEALKDISRLKKSGDKTALRRLDKLLNELREHPAKGSGYPEQLKHDFAGLWSRRITGKHRLIYEIKEELGHINVIQTYGHYSDK